MKIRFGSKLLHVKQTLLFALFGLIVGYFSFVSGTMITGREVVKDFRKGIEYLFQGMPQEQDWLYEAFIVDPSKGQRLLEQLGQFLPEEHPERLDFFLYMKDQTTGSWSLLTSSQSNRQPGGRYLTEEQKAVLEELLHKGIDLDRRPFFGQDNLRNVLIDLTSPIDKNNYVIQLTRREGGLLTYIRNERDTFMAYSFFVLALSVLLGSFFAGRLSRPIQAMTDTALDMAAGQLDIQLNSRRHDDLGLLARSMNTMAGNIRHRIRTMQTMNRIDRAVLSSLSRRELMYKVAGFISEQFGNTGVSVLERIEGGYHILATVPKTGDAENPVIKDEEIPENLKHGAEMPFEFSSPQDMDAIDFLPRLGTGKRIFSIPLFQDEKFMGVFIISAGELSDQDREALSMLADQAGVALKSLHDREQQDNLYRALILSLTRSVDAKSRWTAGHSDRVAELADALLMFLNPGDRLKEAVHMGALLHDIGKMGVPEAILDKPDKLSEEEFRVIQSHPMKGYEILKDVPDFDTVRQIVRSHHERWDGTGYPDGLAGEEIPLPARIITIADVFDAITEDRPYRKGFSIDETLRFLKEQRGKIFDPALLDMFLRIL